MTRAQEVAIRADLRNGMAASVIAARYEGVTDKDILAVLGLCPVNYMQAAKQSELRKCPPDRTPERHRQIVEANF